MLSPKTVGATSGFMGALILEPGEFVSEHYHPYSEEFLYVVSGDPLLRLAGEEIRLGPGDGVLVPTGQRHRLENPGAGRAHVVFCLTPLAPRPELGHVDTEVLPTATGPLPDVGAAV
jgi:putative monooxygenase